MFTRQNKTVIDYVAIFRWMINLLIKNWAENFIDIILLKFVRTVLKSLT